MSLRAVIGIIIFYVLFVIWSLHTAHAVQTDFKVRVTPRTKHQAKTNEVMVMSATTNKDGTYSIYISACGTMIEVITKRELVEREDPRLENAAMTAVRTACK